MISPCSAIAIAADHLVAAPRQPREQLAGLRGVARLAEHLAVEPDVVSAPRTSSPATASALRRAFSSASATRVAVV